MARLPDYNIIFLKPTLEEVYECLDDTPIATIYNRRFITLSPNEFYTQISNYQFGINLGMDYKVELIDCCEKVLLDITEKTTISQFNHSVTGKSQIVYEINKVGQTFNIPVHLKFTQTTNPTNVFYSNPFYISSDLKGTTRFDYRGFGVAFGIDYATPNVMCSVRLKGYFTKHEPKTGNENYLATDGDTLTLLPTPNILQNFQIEYQDNHGLKAFEYIRYLTHAVVFLTKNVMKYGLRAESIETASESVLGSSNFFKASYLAKISDTDDYTPALQITPLFTLIYKSPFGIYRPRIPAPPSNIWVDANNWEDTENWTD